MKKQIIHFNKIYIFLLILIFFCQINNKINVTTTIKKWPHGIIKYKYASRFNKREKIIIQRAMKAWEYNTKIKFVYCPDCPRKFTYFIFRVKDREYSSSTVGFAQYPKLQIDKVYYYIVLHELGHCLGLRHEHCRPDRDKYVKIIWKNIKKYEEDSFIKLNKQDFLYPYQYFKYDYNSIMHYWNDCFSKNKNKTIISITNKKIEIHTLSSIDYKKIRYIYGQKKNSL